LAGLFDSNAVPFMVDTLPECNQQTGNHSPGSAQEVKLPTIRRLQLDGN